MKILILIGLCSLILLGGCANKCSSQDLCSIEPYQSSNLCHGNITLNNNQTVFFNKYQGNNNFGWCG